MPLPARRLSPEVAGRQHMTGSATGRCGSAFEKQTGEGLDAWKRKMGHTSFVTRSSCEPG